MIFFYTSAVPHSSFTDVNPISSTQVNVFLKSEVRWGVLFGRLTRRKKGYKLKYNKGESKLTG